MSPAVDAAVMEHAASAVTGGTIEFADPHPQRRRCRCRGFDGSAGLQGGWRWPLILATAATILLCINQQFALRFFVGFTQLNTEYFYLLIA